MKPTPPSVLVPPKPLAEVGLSAVYTATDSCNLYQIVPMKFQFHSDGVLVVDECAIGLDDCSDNATCRDTVEGFECACKPGFSGNGITCTGTPITL